MSGSTEDIDTVLHRLERSLPTSFTSSVASSSGFTNSASVRTVLAEEVDERRLDSGDEADFGWKSSKGFRVSGGGGRRRTLESPGFSVSAGRSVAVDEELQAAREEVEALELRELMAAQDAKRGIAHAVLRSAVRHALGTRCARALESWRACATETSGDGNTQQVQVQLAVAESAAAEAAVNDARLEISVVRREMSAALREAEAETREAATRGARAARREGAAAESAARREADRGRREAQAARGEAEEARREAGSLSRQLLAALAENAKREAEGAAREAAGFEDARQESSALRKELEDVRRELEAARKRTTAAETSAAERQRETEASATSIRRQLTVALQEAEAAKLQAEAAKALAGRSEAARAEAVQQAASQAAAREAVAAREAAERAAALAAESAAQSHVVVASPMQLLDHDETDGRRQRWSSSRLSAHTEQLSPHRLLPRSPLKGAPSPLPPKSPVMTKEDLQAAVAEAASRAATQALSRRDAESDAEVERVRAQGREDTEAAAREVKAARAEAEQARRDADAARRECDEYSKMLEDARRATESLQAELNEACAEIEQHQKLAEAESAARQHIEQQLGQQQKHVQQQSKHIDSQRAAEERGRLHAERQLDLATRRISALEAQLKQRAADLVDPSRGSTTITSSARGTPPDRAASDPADRGTSNQRPVSKPLHSKDTPPRTPAATPPRAATPPPASTYVYVPPGSSRSAVLRSDQPRQAERQQPSRANHGTNQVAKARDEGATDGSVPRLNLDAISDSSARRPRAGSSDAPSQASTRTNARRTLDPGLASAASSEDARPLHLARFEKAGGHASPRRSSPSSTPRGEGAASEARGERSAQAASQYGYTGQLPSPLPAYVASTLAAAASAATKTPSTGTKRVEPIHKLQPPRSPLVRVDAAASSLLADSSLRSATRGVSPPKQPQKPRTIEDE